MNGLVFDQLIENSSGNHFLFERNGFFNGGNLVVIFNAWVSLEEEKSFDDLKVFCAFVAEFGCKHKW